jgi:hypothetical protein
MMHIRCQNCSCGFDAPYWRLGMRHLCPHCETETPLARECVIAFHGSLWSVTFLDFVQLVTGSASQDTILHLLRTLGYERVRKEPLLFRDRKGETLIGEDVHTQIQNDEPKQQRLYHTAMGLWR